jgi:hypothetical protein
VSDGSSCAVQESSQVPLKCFRPLLEVVQQLTQAEADELRAAMHSVLSSATASSMSLDGFRVFAVKMQEVADRQGPDVSAKIRHIIAGIIERYSSNE